jgi:hypothetical protein
VSARQALTAAESAYNNQFNAQSNQFETQYQQKCQESEALRAQLADLQQSYQQMLDATQRQLVAQREDRLRQQITQPMPPRPAAPQAAAPRPMPVEPRRIEPASYQEAADSPTLYRPSSSAEVFGQASDPADQYQWRQPEALATATRAVSDRSAAQRDSRTSQPKEESNVAKGVLSRWFRGRK